MQKTSILVAMIWACFACGVTTAAEPEAQATLNSRVQALEKKTDYYRTKNKKFHVTRGRSMPRNLNSTLKPEATTCRNGILRLTFDPQLQFGGISYAWVKFTAKFPASTDVGDVSLSIVDKVTPACLISKRLSGPVFAGKNFCSFNVTPGDIFSVDIAAYDSDANNINTCNIERDVELKLTNIEVIEPD